MKTITLTDEQARELFHLLLGLGRTGSLAIYDNQMGMEIPAEDQYLSMDRLSSVTEELGAHLDNLPAQPVVPCSCSNSEEC